VVYDTASTANLSQTLGGSYTVSGVVIQEDLNFTFTPPAPAPADTDRVRVYVPLGANEELFGRLKVQVP